MIGLRPTKIVASLEKNGADASPAVADQVRATLQELVADVVDDGIIAQSQVPA